MLGTARLGESSSTKTDMCASFSPIVRIISKRCIHLPNWLAFETKLWTNFRRKSANLHESEGLLLDGSEAKGETKCVNGNHILRSESAPQKWSTLLQNVQLTPIAYYILHLRELNIGHKKEQIFSDPSISQPIFCGIVNRIRTWKELRLLGHLPSGRSPSNLPPRLTVITVQLWPFLLFCAIGNYKSQMLYFILIPHFTPDTKKNNMRGFFTVWPFAESWHQSWRSGRFPERVECSRYTRILSRAPSSHNPILKRGFNFSSIICCSIIYENTASKRPLHEWSNIRWQNVRSR